MKHSSQEIDILRVCFVWSVAVVFIVYAIDREQWLYLLSAERSFLVSTPVKIFVWGGGVSQMVLWTLMMRDAFKRREWAWFFFFFFTYIIGSALYYWLEYRKQFKDEA